LNIGIIGAGATGLVAGYELSKKGHKVTIFEGEDEFGGLVSTIKVGDVDLEKFYHHVFTSDNEVNDLAEELGISEELKWYPSKSGIYINQKFYPFSSPKDLLMFKELSFFERISMGLLVYKAKFIKEWRKLESINSKEWIIKKAGKNVYEKVWGPLMNSKFDVDADKVSAVWIWNKFKLRGSTRGKNLSKELLGYMSGSFGLMYGKLVEGLLTGGCDLLFGNYVKQIKPLDNKTLDVITEKGVYNFDRIIVTAAPEALKEMQLPFPGDYIEKLDKIKYKSNICMMLEMSEQLSPYYWTTVADSSIPFVLMIEHTNLLPVNSYKSNIVYLSRYLDANNELYSFSDQEVTDLFIGGIKKMYPSWDESKILKSHVFRSKYAQPVVGKGYSEIRPDYKTPIQNLFLADMAQIYPEDRGQNYAIRMGKEIASLVNE
jgi:protoporphyrinogen oxidase